MSFRGYVSGVMSATPPHSESSTTSSTAPTRRVLNGRRAKATRFGAVRLDTSMETLGTCHPPPIQRGRPDALREWLRALGQKEAPWRGLHAAHVAVQRFASDISDAMDGVHLSSSTHTMAEGRVWDGMARRVRSCLTPTSVEGREREWASILALASSAPLLLPSSRWEVMKSSTQRWERACGCLGRCLDIDGVMGIVTECFTPLLPFGARGGADAHGITNGHVDGSCQLDATSSVSALAKWSSEVMEAFCVALRRAEASAREGIHSVHELEAVAQEVARRTATLWFLREVLMMITLLVIATMESE